MYCNKYLFVCRVACPFLGIVEKDNKDYKLIHLISSDHNKTKARALHIVVAKMKSKTNTNK